MIEKMNTRSLRKLKEEERERARWWPMKTVVVEWYGGCGGCRTKEVTEVLVAAFTEVRDPQVSLLKSGRKRLLGAEAYAGLYRWVVDHEFPPSHGVWCWRCFKEEAKRWRRVAKR